MCRVRFQVLALALFVQYTWASGTALEPRETIKNITISIERADHLKKYWNGDTTGEFGNVIKYTLPKCESLIGSDYPSGIYHFDGSSQNDVVWMWSINALYCDQSAGGGWTVIQRNTRRNPMITHMDTSDFNKTWDEYATGFGDLDYNFWLGNEWIHRLTMLHGSYELRIELVDMTNNMFWAQYSEFKVSSKEDLYRLWVSGYTGNVEDQFSGHNSEQFSTYDRLPKRIYRTCARSWGSGWWFLDKFQCNDSNLNWAVVPRWGDVHKAAYRSSKMMIRSKNHRSLDARGP